MRVVLPEARRHSAEKILEISLAIGELTFLNPEQLRFAFEVLSEGTIAEKAKLNIHKIPTKIKCSQCGYSGSISYEGPENHLGYTVGFLACEVCGSRDLEILSGRECTIKDFKIKVASRTASSRGNLKNT